MPQPCKKLVDESFEGYRKTEDSQMDINDPVKIFNCPIFNFNVESLFSGGLVPCVICNKPDCVPSKQTIKPRFAHDIGFVTVINVQQYRCPASHKARSENPPKKRKKKKSNNDTPQENDDEDDEEEDGAVTFTTLSPAFVKKWPPSALKEFPYILLRKSAFARQLVQEVVHENVMCGRGIEGSLDVLQSRRAAVFAQRLNEFGMAMQRANWDEAAGCVVITNSTKPPTHAEYYATHKKPDWHSTKDVWLQFTEPLVKISRVFRKSLEVRSFVIIDGNFKYAKLMKVRVGGENVQSDQWRLLMVAMNEIGQIIAFKLCKAESHDEMESLFEEIKKYNLPATQTTSSFPYPSPCPSDANPDIEETDDYYEQDINGMESQQGEPLTTTNDIDDINPHMTDFLTTLTNELNVQPVDLSKDILVVSDNSPSVRNLVERILGERCRTVQDIFHLIARPPQYVNPTTSKLLSMKISEAIYLPKTTDPSRKKKKSREVHPPLKMLSNLVEVFKRIPQNTIKDRASLEGTIRNTIDLLTRNKLLPTNGTNIYVENGKERSKITSICGLDIGMRIFELVALQWNITQGENFGRIPNLYGMDLLDLLQAAFETHEIAPPTPQTQFIWSLARAFLRDEDSCFGTANATNSTTGTIQPTSLRSKDPIIKLVSYLQINTPSFQRLTEVVRVEQRLIASFPRTPIVAAPR
ncbi:hypothetical protein HDU76_006771, partial [Blyttiomyces sp. JEL0837]